MPESSGLDQNGATNTDASPQSGATEPDKGLKQNLRPRHLQLIALGGIIGSSLFIGSGEVIHTVGPASVLSYAIGGLLVVLVMRMLGEMAAAQPTVGSFAEYARTSLGNWAGFTIGWLYWYYWVGVVAFEAVAGAEILHGWLPGVPSWVFSLLLMFGLTLSNLISVRSFGETEFWLASVKVVTIVVFLVVGVLFVLGMWPNAHFSVGNIGMDGFFTGGGFSVIHGVVLVIFAYFGAEIVTIVAAESDQPERAVAKATTTTVWRVLLFYVGSAALLVMITPWHEIPEKTSPFAAAFGRFGIPAAETIMSVVVLTAALSVLNSGLYTASRMQFALRKHGWAPRWVGDTNSRGVPWKSILLSTSVGYIAVLMNYLAPGEVFNFIINSAGAVALFVYAIITASQLRMRQKLEREAPERLKLRMWCYPWLSWLTLIGIAFVLVCMLFVADARSQLYLSLISLAVIVLIYVLIVRPYQSRRSPKTPR